MTDRQGDTSITIDEACLLNELRRSNPRAEQKLLATTSKAMAETGRAVLKALARLNESDTNEAEDTQPPTDKAAEMNALRAISSRDGLASWAGPLLGPSAAAEKIGVSRATMARWRRTKAIIALQKGQRNHVVPMLQFRGAYPVGGVAAVLEMVNNDSNMAWAWLMQPNVRLDGASPVTALRKGHLDPVIALAREMFPLD